MKIRSILVGTIVCALAVAAVAQDGDKSAERKLRERVEASEGRERGAAQADLARLFEDESRWSEAASAWRHARKLRGELGDLEGEARALLAFAEDVAAQGESGGAVAASFEDAKTALRRAREAGSKSVDVALGLARCAEIDGDSQARIEELTTASAAAPPNDIRATWALAAALFAAGRRDEALALYEKMSDAHPTDANLALRVYTAARTMGDEARALSSATRALNAEPENVNAWNSLWYVFSPKQRWGELAAATVEIAKAHPAGMWPAHYAGVACARARRFDEALVWLEKAWTANPAKGNPDARCEAARIYLPEKNDREKTVKLLKEALAIEPLNVQANNLMFFVARRFADEGDVKRAAQLFDVLAKARPNDQIAQNNFANSLRFAGRYEECERAYLAMIEQFPNDAQIRNDYALLLDSLGRTAEARAVLRAAHEVDPMSNDSMENLGFLARAAGDREEALKWFRAAYGVAVTKGELVARQRVNVDDQRWPLPPLTR